ncbi:hypothetical protein [Mangrovicoccus ximenensis]|uniref:hypothetical protein n=1 Tax=Mangrovicoccus ximenensis TaxID=1911570 RepID=UPI0011AE499C|nr:hypothetical protein [Mangrovicoccus ximenensis]
MTARVLLPLLGVLLAAALAATSVTSARMMAPDRAGLAIGAMMHGHAIQHGDLCGGDAAPEHHCPFCHGLPETPVTGHAGIEFLLVPHDGWRRGRDLWRAAQARDLNHSPRAPPAAA